MGVLIADDAGRAEHANACWQDQFDQRDGSWRGDGWHRAFTTEAAQALLAAIRDGHEHRTDAAVDGGRIFDVWAVPASEAERSFCVVTSVDVTQERARAANLLDRATHDEMTGLYNRAQFLEFVAHALDRQRRDPDAIAAVLFIDVDNLKETNDAHGHDAGDRLLREVAHRISAAVRPVDVVARYGGDEFAVLCEDLVASDEAYAIAGRVIDAVNHRRSDVAGTVSVGVAIADDPALEPTAVVGAADYDMYRLRADDPSRGTRPTGEGGPVARVRSTASTSDVLAAMAHELRTPLTSIIGYAQTLLLEAPRMEPAAIEGSVAAIERQGIRLMSILDGMLDLGRIRNSAVARVHPVDLTSVVRDALEAAPPPEGVTVVDRVAGGPRHVVRATREHDLSRAVTNLLTNAYRHGGDTIEITARLEDGHVELVVTDDGPGIPEALLPRIFQPFVRGHWVDSNGRPGTGLGLSLAGAIADASGGSLSHAPVLPHGARFVLRLPIATGAM